MKIKVRQKWFTRSNKIASIVHVYGDEKLFTYPIEGYVEDERETWTPEGHVFSNKAASENDLIKLVAQVDPQLVTPVPASDEGRKDDTTKPRLDLIPPEAIFALGDILAYGANKYADRNWEKGMSWGRVFAACMRHMWEWWGGVGPTNKSFLFGQCDSETKRSHLWHALCCIVFLVVYEERSVGKDDRHKGQAL